MVYLRAMRVNDAQQFVDLLLGFGEYLVGSLAHGEMNNPPFAEDTMLESGKESARTLGGMELSCVRVIMFFFFCH